MICPQGKTIPLQGERERSGVRVRVYRSAQTRKGFPTRSQCMKERHGRTIHIASWYDAHELPTSEGVHR